MIIKICGLQSPQMAREAESCGSDWLGMVFAPSRRRVQATTGRLIAQAVTGCKKVGVFVNAPLEEVKATIQLCRLDMVQLHGDESPDYCCQLEVPIIKAFRADTRLQARALNRFPADWLLLDSFTADQFGGTGKPFDWNGLQQLRQDLTKPLLIAGGLHSGNVRQAIRLLRPDGVDVSGGVESGGQKDPLKMQEFIQVVRQEEAKPC